mmetsp:Transcript_10835/g.31319  ORF Transcript_10835/g.31319 Transcript_10835/m.31319 type:complete len:286 (+) Transcript_10835:38-895(+)
MEPGRHAPLGGPRTTRARASSTAAPNKLKRCKRRERSQPTSRERLPSARDCPPAVARSACHSSLATRRSQPPVDDDVLGVHLPRVEDDEFSVRTAASLAVPEHGVVRAVHEDAVHELLGVRQQGLVVIHAAAHDPTEQHRVQAHEDALLIVVGILIGLAAGLGEVQSRPVQAPGVDPRHAQREGVVTNVPDARWLGAMEEVYLVYSREKLRPPMQWAIAAEAGLGAQARAFGDLRRHLRPEPEVRHPKPGILVALHLDDLELLHLRAPLAAQHRVSGAPVLPSLI